MTKVDIFSGFLGAGKTTLIKKLIEEAYEGEQIVLIENEFGEIGIDGGFLKDAGVEINEMNSGCICCSLVGDFGKALEQVLEQFHPDRILIEPSGVGKLSDIIQAVRMKTPEGLIAFCQGIQAGSPVDAYVSPEPWAMPGYADQVIMAAGAFTQGSSIELSADGPLRPPYTAFFQGGLTYESGKAGILLAVNELLN